jgi:hypothetical protein
MTFSGGINNLKAGLILRSVERRRDFSTRFGCMVGQAFDKVEICGDDGDVINLCT